MRDWSLIHTDLYYPREVQHINVFLVFFRLSIKTSGFLPLSFILECAQWGSSSSDSTVCIRAMNASPAQLLGAT